MKSLPTCEAIKDLSLSDRLFLIIGFGVSVFLAFLFVLIADLGDSPNYINYALKINGADMPTVFVSTSPLYSLILAGIIKISGFSSLPRVVLVFQFILIFFTSLLLVAILKHLISTGLSKLAGVFFYFSLATLSYGYELLTEIITVFLFILTVFIIFGWIGRERKKLLILLGIVTSQLILARFNTIPLVLAYLLIIVYSTALKEKCIIISRIIINILFFLIPLLVIMNLYAYFNYINNNFYGIFPSGGSTLISRNAILATIDGNESVSSGNKRVYEIFLKAVDNNSAKKPIEKKGSLLKKWNPDFMTKLYSGYPIYSTAFSELCNFYGIDPNNPEPFLSEKLKSFYTEIYSQNRSQIWIMRFYSLLNSFRSSSGITMSEMGKKNLNLLPEWIIYSYKIIWIVFSILTFIASVLILGLKIIKWKRPDPYLLTVLVLYLSFYFINFFFGTVGDANRFKYPSDPLMIGLFIFFLLKIIKYQKEIGITKIFRQNFPHTKTVKL